MPPKQDQFEIRSRGTFPAVFPRLAGDFTSFNRLFNPDDFVAILSSGRQREQLWRPGTTFEQIPPGDAHTLPMLFQELFPGRNDFGSWMPPELTFIQATTFVQVFRTLMPNVPPVLDPATFCNFMADMNTPNNSGVTPLQIAKEMSHADLVGFLEALVMDEGASGVPVDDSGKNYYGQTKLLLASADGQVQKDLTETDTATSGALGVAVQAVEWSPTRDEFILLRGYQPAKVTLWSWDSTARTVTCAKVLTEKAHRNFIRFNHFGSLVCIAGFGNLAGEMDFYGRSGEKTDFVRISKCEANCAVSAEWGADGRHLMTAVLFPRMRVDNGITLWNALMGTKVVSSPSDELYEVEWKPGLSEKGGFEDVTSEEISRAGAAAAADTGGTTKKAAYKPPKARGTGDSTVAAMMRGELSVPDEDKRRRPWQDRKKEKEEERPSPPVSPNAEAAPAPLSPAAGVTISPKPSPTLTPKPSPKDGLEVPPAGVQRQISPMGEAEHCRCL
eukprot:s1312_g4.t1